MNVSLENVLNRPGAERVKDLNDDHTVTTRGSTICSSMRSSRTSLSASTSWADASSSLGRRVHFSEEESTIVGRIPRREDLSPEEKWDTWWSTSEFQAIRLAAKFTTKHVRKNDKDGIQRIDTGFNTALHVSCTAFDEELEALLRVPVSTLYGPLEGWCKRKAPVRGLEKYISPLQKELRLQYVAEARTAVVSMTQSGEHDDEEVRMIYREYSRHALVYSRFMGHTDMLAAREEEEEPEKRGRLHRRLSGLGRQRSSRNLTRESSRRQLLTRQPSKREVNRQASMNKLVKEHSSRKLEREGSNRRLLRGSNHGSSHGAKLNKEPSIRELAKEASLRKLTRELSSQKLSRGSSHRHLPEKRGVRRTPTPHDVNNDLDVSDGGLTQ